MTWGGRTATSAAQARETLLLRAQAEAPSWIETELLGASRQARRRHEAQQATERAEARARAEATLALAALPDADLEWLLSIGWQP